MKAHVFFLLLSIPTFAQTIQNPGFETPRDTNRTLPADWRVDTKAGYSIALDSTAAKNGRRSLRIASVGDGPFTSGGFSQSATVQMSEPALVHLRGFVKTDNPAGVGIWWNSWRDWKHKGFAHSNEQVKLRPTDEWQSFDLVLPTSAEINQFTFGAYLNSRGSVWFDDLRFETAPAGTGEPSAKVNAYVQKAIALVKKHALVRDSIPWPQTEAEMLAFARGMQTTEDAYPVIGILLNVMWSYGDNHSHFLAPSGVKNLEADESDDKGPQPQARYLGDGVGYIAVPQFYGINDTRGAAFATQIQQLIQGIDTAQTVSDWVVDLRGNTGGNVWPMVAGLVPLYGNQAKSQYKRETKVQRPYRLRTPPGQIAVLIDGRTGSSGEFTALSFIGLPNVRSFGTHSAGYTTGNADYKLPDGAILFIAESVGEDRAGKKYPHGIAPDEEIKTPVKTPPTDTTDPTLDAAKAWLLNR